MVEAINRAVNECIKDDILAEILLQHRAEVIELVLTTFNKELHEKYLKEDAREEGLAEGLCAAVLTASSFTSDINCIHTAITKNAAYKDVTLEQIKEILNQQ